MDEFQLWFLGNFITISSFFLLGLNLTIATFSRNERIIFGAIALFCAWVSTVGSLMLLRDADGEWARIIIDSFAAIVFYRIAERDPVTRQRHDWAALICFSYVFLVLKTLTGMIYQFENTNTLIAISNVVFYLKILLNVIPVFGLQILNRPLLIATDRKQAS